MAFRVPSISNHSHSVILLLCGFGFGALLHPCIGAWVTFVSVRLRVVMAAMEAWHSSKMLGQLSPQHCCQRAGETLLSVVRSPWILLRVLCGR